MQQGITQGLQKLIGFKKAPVVFFLFLVVLGACKKKDTTVADPAPVIDISQTDAPDLACHDLPPTPIPLGWIDTTNIEDKNVNAFFYNPLNANEIIYIANGDLFGYNKICVYNIPTKKINYLCDNGNYLPRVNAKGWIVFNRSDLNVYKIKTNGDSLTKITSSSMCSDPKWDYQGNSIYYFETASGSLPSRLVQVDRNGIFLNTLPLDYANTALAHKSNRIAYLKAEGGIISIYRRDLATSSETLVISVAGAQTTFSNLFNNLTFDAADENLYWSNSGGIFKCNLATPAIEMVFKNCPNIIYDRPMLEDHKMTFGCKVTKALSTVRLLHQYKAVEMELASKQLHEVKIFP